VGKLIIDEIDDDLLRRLKASAQENNRSVTMEATQLLAQAVRGPAFRQQWVARAREIAAMTPKDVVQIDSVFLLREDRDR